MSDERKVENEIINYSVNRGNRTYANEMKRKWRNLGTESGLAESDRSGNYETTVVYSIDFTKNGWNKIFWFYKLEKNCFPHEISVPLCI